MTPKSNKPNQNKNTSNPKIKFEIFQNADDQLHYFHLKDSNDRAFLFSQGYKTSKSRDRGLQSTVNNLVKPDRYFKVSEGEQPYFILKSGNNQRIAKSCNFKSIAEMNEYLELITCQELEIPIRSLDEKVQKAPSNTISEKTEKRREPTEKLPRYSFRINMYPD